MLVTGFGIGLVMQVLVVAVQNAVNYEDLGVATSGVTLFRNIGSSVGVAVIGSVFANALSSRLSSAFPGGTAPSTTSVPKTLPPVVRSTYLDAYAGALDRAFLVTAFVGAAAFAVSWTIKQLPMRETVTTQQLGEAFAAPKPDDSLSEIARALGVLIGRPRTRAVLDRLAVDSSVDLPAAQCWVLVRVMRDPDIDIDELGHECDVPAQVLASALADLAARGLVEVVHPYGQARQFRVSSEGNVIAVRLVTTARIRLDALLAGWSPDRYPDLARFLTQLAAEVVPEPKRAHQRATTAA
jgi:hypothetical protein